MKKVFFSLAVLATVALVSCGGKKTEEAVDTDTTMAVVEEVAEVAVDSNADTTAAVEAAAAVETPAADSAQ